MLFLLCYNAILTSTPINGEMNLSITTENALTTENNDDDSGNGIDIDKLIAKLIVVNGTLCYNKDLDENAKDLVENATTATTNRSDNLSMELGKLDCMVDV
jgi:hypothetical protein